MDLVLRTIVTAGGVAVVTASGELDLATLPRLREELVQASAAAGAGTLVVDLDGVTSIDDAGLGALVGALGRRRAHGGDMTLVCTTERLLELLALTRLDRVFTVHPSVTAAIAAAR